MLECSQCCQCWKDTGSQITHLLVSSFFIKTVVPFLNISFVSWFSQWYLVLAADRTTKWFVTHMQSLFAPLQRCVIVFMLDICHYVFFSLPITFPLSARLNKYTFPLSLLFYLPLLYTSSWQRARFSQRWILSNYRTGPRRRCVALFILKDLPRFSLGINKEKGTKANTMQSRTKAGKTKGEGKGIHLLLNCHIFLHQWWADSFTSSIQCGINYSV